MQMHNSLQARGSHLGGKGSLYNGFFHLQPDSRQALRCPEGTYTVPLCILPCSYMQDKALHSFILVDLIYFQCRCHDKWWQICPVNQIKKRIAKLIWLINKRINLVGRWLQFSYSYQLPLPGGSQPLHHEGLSGANLKTLLWSLFFFMC